MTGWLHAEHADERPRTHALLVATTLGVRLSGQRGRLRAFVAPGLTLGHGATLAAGLRIVDEASD